MKKDIKSKWVAALRSGDFKQTRHILRDADTHEMCCLGVLCHVVDPDGWLDRPDSKWSRHRGVHTTPDRGVVRHTGLTTDNLISLVRLNDDDQATFDEIADWIEENL